MNIEELNKTQIILLTLLTSFITSIATGIVTVSLVEQAPPGFTQTVNRVVERTVEKVVPAQVAGSNVVTKETTVVVKQEDLITKSIGEVTPSVVSIRQDGIAEDGTPTSVFLGWGTMLSNDGLIATDSSFISDNASYIVETSDKKIWKASTVSQDESRGIALLSIKRETPHATETDTKIDPKKTIPTFTPVKMTQTPGLRLGQTVIAFDGAGKRSVSVGIISSLVEAPAPAPSAGSSATNTPPITIASIDVSAGSLGNSTGGPLTTIFGEAVAVRGTLTDGKVTYVPIEVVEEIATPTPPTPQK